mmetsp:Transcript_5950/g.13021  ORF Transcript_5950/g.13021 Transcript_5950/m.13021 type:complete len:1140 (-) Transcript_5950:4782-8201(-)
MRLPPNTPWNGIVMATLRSDEEARLFRAIVERWRPTWVVAACHGSTSRNIVMKWLGHKISHSSANKWSGRCIHSAFGGVTDSEWKVWYLSKTEDIKISLARMTTTKYSRPLQTALDDTLPGSQEARSFEVCERIGSQVGWVTDRGGHRFPVYDSGERAPDLGKTPTEVKELWVRAKSVWSKQSVIRRVQLEEVLGLWDYADKNVYRGLSKSTKVGLLRARQASPPAKILRMITFLLCNEIQEHLLPNSHQAFLPISGGQKASQANAQSALETQAIQRVEATQADDAAIEMDHWAMAGETKQEADARQVLRKFAHLWWCKNLEAESKRWLRKNGNRKEDRDAVADCVRRARGSDYWEWRRGSRLFFWRWPEEWMQDARDGIEFWHLSDPPKGNMKSKPCADRDDELMLRTKVFSCLFRWYFEQGFHDLLITCFGVKKGLTDIRAVWNASSNGLNATLWAPKFAMATFLDTEGMVVKWLSTTVLDYLKAGSPPQDYSQEPSIFKKSFQYDSDVGQMFHNFLMHAKERHSHGVRFVHTRNDGSVEEVSFWRWCVLNFGCRCSSYAACQGEERILEVCHGDPSDKTNPFEYCSVWENWPTAMNYDPSMSRVMLLRSDGELATRDVPYVDDIRGAARGEDEKPATQAQKTLAKGMNRLGNQEAARKRRIPSLAPGAWTGKMLHCTGPYPVRSTTLKKWKRGKDSLQWILDRADESSWIDTAELRRIAGVWVDLTDIYKEARCFLKGMFNALEAFREGRDLDGWRLLEAMEESHDLEFYDSLRRDALEGYPARTKITPELLMHVRALQKLFNSEEPRVVEVRPREANMLRYIVADASAEGFGYGTQFPEMQFVEREGMWTPEFGDSSSNLREATNIAHNLKRDIESGMHDGCELWCGTDNAVWSAVWNKGMSTARALFYLMVDIKQAAYDHSCFVICFHISGNRMIATGIDGLSRGDTDAGTSLGFDIRLFLPLNITAFDVPDNGLDSWCRSWMGDDYDRPLDTMEWFAPGRRVHTQVWAPPPAGALIALKELAKLRLKRPYEHTHVVLIPRILYQEEWRSRFEKEMDIWFLVSCNDVWPHSAFEPLVVGLCFPLHREYPWLLRLEREKVVAIGRSLSQMSKESHIRVGDYLRKLWRDPRSLPEV